MPEPGSPEGHKSMIPKKPAPDLIKSAFTRVFDALWVDTVFGKDHAPRI